MSDHRPPSWDRFSSQLIIVGGTAVFSVAATLMMASKWVEAKAPKIEGSFVEISIQSLTMLAAFITIVIQAWQNKTGNEIQERTINNQNAQLVIDLFVRIRRHVSELRELWIDCSEHADSHEILQKHKANLEEVKIALYDDVEAAELLFRNSGREFRKAINLLISYIHKNPLPTSPGVRNSNKIIEFNNEAADIDMLIDHVWRQQPGVAVFDAPLDRAEGKPVPDFQRER